MKKIENINEESINAMMEFRQKQIQSNIRLHIIFFIFVLFLNIGLLIFIIVYKSKISEIKRKTSNNSLSINSNKDSIIRNENQIQHRIVNIIANSFGGYCRFSYIIENSKELSTIKNYIAEFYKGKNMNLDTNNMYMYFKYQGIVDGDSYSTFREKAGYGYYNLFLIESEDKYRFGFFIENLLTLDEDNKYTYKENDCFLFSFQKEGLFKCIGDKNKLKIVEDDDDMLIFGNNDIVIKNNYLLYDKKMGSINFPFKSFDVSTINSNVFTGMTGEFSVNGIEVYSLDF